MKAFSFFFIVYIFFLMARPCQDMLANVDDCQNETTAIAHIDSANETEETADLCSPFCVCSCCSHPVSIARLTLGVTLETTLATVPKLTDDYKNPSTNTFNNSIWQPPKA
ncbi:MAG: DUF6660 family protein [Pyrinomonadaceae bacterium]